MHYTDDSANLVWHLLKSQTHFVRNAISMHLQHTFCTDVRRTHTSTLAILLTIGSVPVFSTQILTYDTSVYTDTYTEHRVYNTRTLYTWNGVCTYMHCNANIYSYTVYTYYNRVNWQCIPRHCIIGFINNKHLGNHSPLQFRGRNAMTTCCV